MNADMKSEMRDEEGGTQKAMNNANDRDEQK